MSKDIIKKIQSISDANVKVEVSNNFDVMIVGNGLISYVNIELNIEICDCKIVSDTWERAYGDLSWHTPFENERIPWYFAGTDGEKVFCYGVKTGANALCYWSIKDDNIVLTLDVRNGRNPLLLNGELELCTLCFKEYECDAFSALCDFCKVMCDNPRIPDRQIFGGNDWYCNYGDNSFDKILTHTKRIVECTKNCSEKPFMVIDDGWEICHHQSENDDEYYNGGPWRYANDNFVDMKKMADAIHDNGAIPGIWLRPLWTVEKYPKEYLLKSKGIKDTLDPSHPEVLKLIKRDIETIKSWGYKLIKHDFTSYDIFGQWGFEMTDDMFKDKIDFYDKTKTTAQIIKNLYMTIREAAGDDILLMGCNTMSHLSAGIFDIQRTGDDTSGLDFERTKKYGVNTLAFRMCQHNAFYAVDADCVGITKYIDWNTNKKWLDVLSKSGTPLFVSIAEDSYTDEIKNDVSKAMENTANNSKISKPLDWFDTKTPQKWESSFGVDEYDWE